MSEDRLNYACGMSASQAKKVMRFILQEFFHKLIVNTKERRFEILIHKKITDESSGEEVTFEDRFGKEFISYFQSYWGEVPGFKLVYYKGIMTELLDD